MRRPGSSRRQGTRSLDVRSAQGNRSLQVAKRLPKSQLERIMAEPNVEKVSSRGCPRFLVSQGLRDHLEPL